MSALGEAIKTANADRERNECTFKLSGTEVTIYATPITGMDLEAITRRHKDFINNPTVSAAVDMIIRKAQTESGDQAFDAGDKPILLRQDLEFISHIRNELFPGGENESFDDESLDDEIKN